MQDEDNTPSDKEKEEDNPDEDVSEMVEDVTGEEPKPGETFTDIVNRAEKERHHPPDKDEEAPEEA